MTYDNLFHDLWFQHLVEQAEQGAGLQTDAILETISHCHDGHQVRDPIL